MQPLVALYRVSSDKQGKSGLGLEAQKALVKSYQIQDGGPLIAELTEIESGGKDDRPTLVSALRLCRKHRAKLVIATLDRLARDTHFIAGLMKSDIPFVCADAPHDGPLVLQIKAAMAEEERRKIRERTRRALVAYRDRGGLLGAARPNARPLTIEARRKGAHVSKSRAARFYGDIVEMIRAKRAAGATLKAIADELNATGRITQSGLAFTPTTVHRLLTR